ncbi:hypothetical protein [Gimesia sp.]|uniref:hypothetical protein n=1 Tax=Gimesia sp. TaxID=2024833 RepID=UPI003A907D6E
MENHQRMLSRIVAALTAAVLLAPASAMAGKLQPSQLPQDTAWLLHLDFEALSASKLAEKLREAKPQLTEGVHHWFQQEYGIDPPEDLRSITMYSRDFKRYTGTVILQADYERSKAMEKMEQASQLKKTTWNDLTLYTVTIAHHHGDAAHAKHADRSSDKRRDQAGKKKSRHHDKSGGKQMTVAFVDDNTIVLGSSVPNTQAAVKLLKQDGRSLSTDSPLLSERVADAWIYGAAIDLKRLKQNPLPMPVLQHHERITWSFGNRDGRLFEHAELVAASEEVAQETLQVVEGIAAYETLWAEGSPPMKSLMKNTRIQRDGNVVEVSWDGDTETVLKALKDLGSRMKTWKHVWASDDDRST